MPYKVKRKKNRFYRKYDEFDCGAPEEVKPKTEQDVPNILEEIRAVLAYNDTGKECTWPKAIEAVCLIVRVIKNQVYNFSSFVKLV